MTVREPVARLQSGFAFVGLTDDYRLSVCLFHAKFGGSAAYHHSRDWIKVLEEAVAGLPDDGRSVPAKVSTAR